MSVRSLSVLALLVFPIAGCNDVTDPPAPLSLTFVSWEPPPHDQVPVEGVRVCQLDTNNCEMTDANGKAVLMLPFDEETGYTRDKEGYAPWLVPFIMSANGGEIVHIMPTVQYIADVHDQVMSPYPMRATGTVSAEVIPNFVGATFELDGATGSSWYVDAEWNWSPDLAATTSKAIGGFTEVTPGEVQVQVGGTADRCVPGFLAWPGDGVNSIRLPVREGYVTNAYFSCPPP